MKKRHSATATRTRATRSPGQAGDSTHENIRDWLRDAYAMERALESALQKQAQDQDLSANVRQRAATHLEETRRHAEAVQAALQSLGTDTSAIKTGAGVVAQFTKSLGAKFARDERIKNLLDAYSMEHFEIACYTALAAAAERAGLPHIVQTCRSILPEEERMAEALLESLPDEVVGYLFQTEAETTRTE